MMQDRYTLNDLARAEIDDLRAAGVALTDDDIVLINALAADVLRPDVRRALSRGRPVLCGGAWLWPLTIAAADWYTETGVHMPDPTAALAYAMASRNDANLHETDWPLVRRWYRALRCRAGELALAMSEVIAQDEETEIPHRADERGLSPGELSAAMMATAGGTPELWERQVSIGYVRAVLNAHNAQVKANGAPPEVARATMALGMACQKIIDRDKASNV
jgi:hypothetical protein